MKTAFIGVEIGGTKQQVALVDSSGIILHQISEKLPIPNGASDILHWLKAQIRALLQNDMAVQGIGVGFGGILETATGKSLASVQVKGWMEVNLRQWFEENFQLPTVVANDTVAGGYGELLCGSGRGHEKFYYTNIGTGIGGAMFMNGKPYDGIGYGGCYMGHTYVPSWAPDGEMNIQKVENICSGTAIERRLRSQAYVPKDSLLYQWADGDLQKLNCALLARAASERDPFALQELDRTARSYAIGLCNFITLFSPSRVSIGGGVIKMDEILLAPVRKYVNELSFIAAKDRFDIVRCALGDDAVLVGAALFARDGFHAV